MRIPLRSIATLVMAVGVATCSDAPSGPLRHPVTTPDNGSGSGPVIGRGRLSMQPVFSQSALAAAAHLADFGIDFTQVRVVIVRPVADTVKDTTVTFRPGQGDVTLDFTVDVKSPNEVFTGAMDYKSPSGVVFHGETKVQAHAPDQPAPPQAVLVVNYVGPGSKATKIAVSPKAVNLLAPGSTSFSVTASDASGATLSGVPVNWTTSDASIATISQTGVLQATGKRGTVTVTALTPTNLTDNASATISLPAAGMSLVSGGGQSGKVGTSLGASAVVRVAAADGVGVPGVSVNFAAPAGGGVGSSSATTDANGTAASTLKLGTLAGPQSFAAAAGAFSVSIPATATPGDPAAIVAVSGGGQSDTLKHALKNPLVAKVTDQFNNPVPNVAVSWSKSGTGSLGAASSTTNADGAASMSYTLGSTIGSETITASAGGGTATFTVQAIAGAPSVIAAVSGGGQTGRVTQALAAPFVVHVTDDAGNAVAGATVSWSATNGTLAASTATDASGNASNLMTLGAKLGPATATASIVNGKSVGFTATATPGIVAKLAIRTGAPNGVAGVVLAPAIQIELQDAQGNLTTAANAVTVALGTNPGNATLGGTLTKNAAAGVASFDDLTVDKVGMGYTLTVASAGAPSVSTAPFNVAVGNPTGIQIVAGGGQTGTVNTAALTPPSVKLSDANNNPIIGALVAFTPAAGSGSVSPAAPVATNGQGIATLTSWTFGTTAGPQSMTVSAAGLPSVTINAAALAGAAAGLQFVTQPTNVRSGATISPTVSVRVVDQFGNAVTSGSPSVNLGIASGPAGALLTGAGPLTVANGVVAFPALSANLAGAYTLKASSPGLVDAVSSAFQTSAGSSAGLSILAGGAQTGVVNTAAAVVPSVKLVDANNNPVAGVAVTFTPSSGSGTISPSSPITTDAQGVATLTAWTFGTTAGAQDLGVSAPGVAAITIHATAIAGAAAKLGITTQPSAAGTSGVVLPTQPVLQVQDQFGNAQGAGIMQVTAIPSSGSATGNVITANNFTGVAAFTALALTGAGNVTLTFSALGMPGLASATSTPVSIAAGTPTHIALVGSPSISLVAGTLPSPTPTVKATDDAGNPVAGVAVTIKIAPQAQPTVFLYSRTINTLSDGTLPFLNESVPTTAGVYTVTATAAGLVGSPVTLTATVTAASASKLAFLTQPAAAVINTAQTVQVQEQDAFGNRVTTASDSIALTLGNAGTAMLVGGARTNAVAGVASFSVSVNTSGTYTLTAAAAALLPATSGSFSISNPAPSAIAYATPGTVSFDRLGTLSPSSYPAVYLNDNSGNHLANTASTVKFAVAAGSCTITGGEYVTTTTDAVGAASLPTTSLQIPTFANPGGSCTVRATASSLGGLTLDFRIIAVSTAANVVTWMGAQSDADTAAGNWRTGAGAGTPGVPSPVSTIFIPRSVAHSPKFVGNLSVASIMVETGGTVDLGGATHTLFVTGDVNTNTSGSITNGVLSVSGSGSVSGILPTFVVTGGAPLLGAATTASSLKVSAGTFDFNGNTLTLTGDLVTTGSGTLTMAGATYGTAVVGGTARFGGGSTTGLLTRGSLVLAGNFVQTDTGSASSFAPSGSNFNTYFQATSGGAQTVSFATPQSSFFANVVASHSTTFLTRTLINGPLTTSGSGTVATFQSTELLANVVVQDGTTLKFSATTDSIAGSLSVSGTGVITNAGTPIKLVVSGNTSTSAGSNLSGVAEFSSGSSTFPHFLGTSPAIVYVDQAASLSLDETVTGAVYLNQLLTVGNHNLTISGAMTVDGSGGSGALGMTSTSHTTVGGTFSVLGTSASVAGGILELKGDLVEDEAIPTSLSSSGLVVLMSGTAAQLVTISHPGISTSPAHISTLRITNAKAHGVAMNSDIKIKTLLDITAGAGFTVNTGLVATVQNGAAISIHAGARLTLDGRLSLATGSTCTTDSLLLIGGANLGDAASCTVPALGLPN